jgi:hypothetical protein
MPHVGLQSKDGKHRFTWKEIESHLQGGRYASDLEIPLYPSDPALLAFMVEVSGDRRDVDPAEVSASQLEKGVRRLWLEGTRNFYTVPTREISSIFGTMKHMAVNKDRVGFIAEERLQGPDGTAKCDTLYVAGGDGLLVDLKNIKTYKVKMMLTGDILKEGMGYVYQVNLWRVLLQIPENRDYLLDKYKAWLRPEQLVVKRQRLTCCPPDLDKKKRQELEKLVSDPDIIPINVPILPDGEVLRAYREKRLGLDRAYGMGYAPLCTPEERWEKFGYPKACIDGYCPVVSDCRAVSAEYGEEHPIDVWERLRAQRAAEPKTTRKRTSA